MQIRELSPALGVEVSGLDLTQPVDDAARASLLRAFDEHHLLMIRAPELRSQDQLRFAALFGPPWDEMGTGLVEYVSNTRDDRIIDSGPLLFHSDLAFTKVPTLALSLYAVEVPQDGSPTLFANAVQAWKALSAQLRDELRRQTARHLFDLGTQRGDRPYRDEDTPADQPRALHPVRLAHPRTGVEILYVSEMQTDRILELEPEASSARLAELFAALYAPGNVYEHRWQPGDLAVWDNLALQHARPDMPAHEPRTLRRVQLATAGVADQVGYRVEPARS